MLNVFKFQKMSIVSDSIPSGKDDTFQDEMSGDQYSMDSSLAAHLEYLTWPKKFPELVGSDIFRAEACVKWNTGFYVVKMRHTRTKSRPVLLNKNGEPAAHDFYRVVLWLDDRNCVAVTPIVG